MRYLKRFNEDLDNQFKEELNDFCETNLAYLLDEGTTINVSYRHSYKINYARVPAGADLYLVEITLEQSKPWNEIKDYMIPFLTRLRNKYEIIKGHLDNNLLDIEFYLTTPTGVSLLPIGYRIEDLIKEENFKSSKLIKQISFIVTGYKPPKKSLMTKIKSFFK